MKDRFTYYIPTDLHLELTKEAHSIGIAISNLLTDILDQRYINRKKGLAQLTVELATAERTSEILRHQVKEMSQNTAEWEEFKNRFQFSLRKKKGANWSKWAREQWVAQIKKEFLHIKNMKNEDILKVLEGTA